MKTPFFTSSELVTELRDGKPVLFPTDTLPALGALPSFADQLWKIKNRPRNKPLILMGSSQEQLFEFVKDVALKDALTMANLYWPGPLTMVLPSSSFLVNALNPEGDSIGMRVPASNTAKDLLLKSGPLATTSANFSGEKPVISPKEAAKCFPDIPLLGPLPWPEFSCVASTVISWQAVGNWHLLRKGVVIPESLAN